MAHLNEPDLVGTEALKPAEEPVNAVTGITKDAANAPLVQAFPEKVADCRHSMPPLCGGLPQKRTLSKLCRPDQ